MATLPQSRRLAKAHIEGQRRLRLIAQGLVGQAWRNLGSWNRADVSRFVELAVPAVTSAQRASVHLTDAYLAQALFRRPLGVNPADLIGAAVRNGTPPETVYERPFVNVWSALKDGKPFEDAFRSGLARAQSAAAMDVQLSMRATAGAVQSADEGIYGYERVADSGACEFCQEVDGAYVKSADAMPLHNHCGCGLEPLTAPDAHAVFLPSGARIREYQNGPLLSTPPPDTVAVHDHGELGPVLTGAGEHFTTEAQALD
jgi:hypothetical protein